jgi:hypothetical protein
MAISAGVFSRMSPLALLAQMPRSRRPAGNDIAHCRAFGGRARSSAGVIIAPRRGGSCPRSPWLLDILLEVRAGALVSAGLRTRTAGACKALEPRRYHEEPSQAGATPARTPRSRERSAFATSRAYCSSSRRRRVLGACAIHVGLRARSIAADSPAGRCRHSTGSLSNGPAEHSIAGRPESMPRPASPARRGGRRRGRAGRASRAAARVEVLRGRVAAHRQRREAAQNLVRFPP